MQDNPSDRIGGTARIIHQFAEMLVARFVRVLLEGGEQIVKRLQRQGERRHRFGLQTLHQCGFRRLPRADFVQFARQKVQAAFPLFGRGIAFVRQIVRITRKGIHGVNRAAQPARQHNRADWEIFIMVRCAHGADSVCRRAICSSKNASTVCGSHCRCPRPSPDTNAQGPPCSGCRR